MFIALAAISTIATLFGFRARARKAARHLGRKAEVHPVHPDSPKGIVGEQRKENTDE